MLRYLTAGESHGPALTAIVAGFPSGIALDTSLIDRQLQRRCDYGESRDSGCLNQPREMPRHS